MSSNMLSIFTFVYYLLYSISACPEGEYKQCVKCPEDFVQLNKGCYYFSSEYGTWLDAVKYCGNLDSDVVNIESVQESFAINLHIYEKHEKSNAAYWTSGSDLHNDGEYIWMSSGKPFTYTNWCNGEPDNDYNGNEDCIHIIHWASGNTCWNDAKCSSTNVYSFNAPLHFICEYKPNIVL